MHFSQEGRAEKSPVLSFCPGEVLPNWETSAAIYQLEASVVPKVWDAPLSQAGNSGQFPDWQQQNCPAGSTKVLDTPALGQGGDWGQSEDSAKGFEWHWHF